MGTEPFRKDSNEILRLELKDTDDEQRESTRSDVEKIKTIIARCKKARSYDNPDDFEPPDYTPASELATIHDHEAWSYFVNNYKKEGISLGDSYSEWNDDSLEHIFYILPDEIMTNPEIVQIFLNHSDFNIRRLSSYIQDSDERQTTNFELLSHTSDIKTTIKKSLLIYLVEISPYYSRPDIYKYFLNTQDFIEIIKKAFEECFLLAVTRIPYLISQASIDKESIRQDPDIQKRLIQFITKYISETMKKKSIPRYTQASSIITAIKNILLLDIILISDPEAQQALENIIHLTLENGDIQEIKKIREMSHLTEQQKSYIDLVCKVAEILCLSGYEYSILLSCTHEELLALTSKQDANNHEVQSLKKELRKKARSIYNARHNSWERLPEFYIENDGLDACETLGLDEEIMWNFLGANQNRHDALQNVPNFTYSIPNTPEDKKIATAMFRAAGMGTGTQRQTMIDIMGQMNGDLWIQLKTTSAYTDKQPPLSDIGNINLLRIRNEIRLHQIPELLEAIHNLPPENPLRTYALHLLEHPTINVDAITNFVNNPEKFFSSRTGAGEHGDITGTVLEQLDPTHAPGTWNATEARDAIVGGTFDSLNTFAPQEFDWIEIPKQVIRSKEQIDVADTFSDIKTEVQKQIVNTGSTEPFITDLRVQLYITHTSEVTRRDTACCDASLEHILKKGDDIINKSILYYQKTKKFSPDELQSLYTHMQQVKSDALSTKQPILFWKEVATTGWLNSMPLHGLYKRMFGTTTTDIYDSEEHLLDYISTTDEGRAVAKKFKKQIHEHVDSTIKKKRYTVAILAPSDPETATAGSTTGNCDAFGHGKKAHFMINPGTAQLILRENGKIIAQSTITLGKKLWATGKQRHRFFNTLTKETGRLGKALAPDNEHVSIKELQKQLEQFATSTPTITLDSVEVPPNTQQTQTPKDIYTLLQTGLRHLGKKDPLIRQSEIRIGTSYSYLSGNSGLPMDENQDLTVTPLAYSDNMDEKNIVLKESAEPSETRQQTESDGVRPALPTDATTIAIMEEIAFRRSGGESYITGLISMTKELWASTVSTAHRKQKPLSFISHNERGIPNGYLIAYEQNQDTIYITDTATTGTEKGVGGQLLMSLLQSCASDPTHRQKRITMDCRGVTSALAIATKKSAIETLQFSTEDGKNIHFIIEGPTTDQIIGDRLYSFVFTPTM